MATKVSNQITFIEQRKITEIKEWYLATNTNTGVTIDTNGWTEEVQTINETNRYLWNYEEVVYSIGNSEKSDPVIIGFYGKGEDGKDGRGILDITNYYQISQRPVAPSLTPQWPTTAPELTPENKYLWNYEVITYTDNDTKETDPAIIGVYGDSGSDVVTFEVYSPKGFVFKEGVDEIELKIAAFKGTTAITDAVYVWWQWDDDADQYVQIGEEINQTELASMSIFKSDSYPDFKCTMTYDNNTYEDYISLSNETVVYSAVVKFFDGSNVFSSAPYIISYVELYRNNELVNPLATQQYYVGETSVSNNVITTDIPETYKNTNELVYFIYFSNNKYNVVLGQYSSNKWTVINNTDPYLYRNDFDANTTINIVPIYKENISKSRNIKFTVYKDSNVLCETNVTVIDINDPIVSDTAPEDTKEGQLWLNTSVSPYELYIYTNGNWEYFSQQNGCNVYLSKPSMYYIGDLWILSASDAAESNDKFGEGTMIKAINNFAEEFSWDDWEDSAPANTSTLNNVKQYFRFSDDDGMRIGQSNQKFYVNIKATRMSFCEDPLIEAPDIEEDPDPNEVVHIGKESANIRKLVVEGEATFNGNAVFNKEIQFGNFVLKQDSNNSLSLAVQ